MLAEAPLQGLDKSSECPDMQNFIDRRRFLASGVAVAGLANVSAPGATPEPKATQAGPARIRYSAFDSRANLDSYRKGVTKMKEWGLADPNDPRGWDFQAAIHGSQTRTGVPFNQCEHKSWWFFPWHRAYLHFFERIVRAASEDPNFTLPYWDWDTPNRTLFPKEFRDPASSLYDGTRRKWANTGLGFNVQDLNLGGTMASRNFLGSRQAQGFGGVAYPVRLKGAMELQTHDKVHGLISGNMGDSNTAAQDPIFWMHHCNVDRLWDTWLAKGHSNPPDSAWLENLIDGHPSLWTLYDENKTKVEVKTSEFLQGGPRLDYQYDSLNGNIHSLLVNTQIRNQIRQDRMVMMAPPPGAEGNNRMATDIFGDQTRIVVTTNDSRTVIGAAPVKVQAAIQPDKNLKFMQALPLATTAEPNAPSILLNIEDVRSTAAPGVVFRVFLNEPKAGATTNPDEANYVGSIAIFQSSSPHHRMKPAGRDRRGEDFSFDISKLVQSLTQRGHWNPDKIDVTLVSKGVGGEDNPQAEVSFDRVSISIER